MNLRSAANVREHWAAKALRDKKQKRIVRFYLRPLGEDITKVTHIHLIRESKRTLDYDNLVYAFKHIRDCISDLIKPGLAPGQSDTNLIFHYSQRKAKRFGITVELAVGADDTQPVVLTPPETARTFKQKHITEQSISDT